jgi:hypothetical protein
MSISDDSLRVDVFNTIRTIIVSVSPVVTNTTTSATTVASIRAAYNDKTTTTPQIVIEPAVIDEDSWKFSSFQGKKSINVTVECYYKNSLGVDQLTDQVTKAVKEASISGMELVAVSSDVAFVNPNMAKFHLTAITFTFDRE